MGCGKVWVWITNILLWVSIVLIIIAFCTDYTVFKITSIAIVSPVGVAYYCLMFIYSYYYYFPAVMKITRFYDYIDKVFKSSPLITMKISCYHLVYVHRSRSSSGGWHREITYEQTEPFYYRTWRDVTGQLKLETSISPYILLDLGSEVQFIADGTINDFKRVKEDFIARNKRDRSYNFNRTDKLPNLHKRILIQVTEESPCLFGRVFFILFGLLSFNAVYSTYLDYYCHRQKITIKKGISTRQDVNIPEIRRLNANLDPVIITASQIVTFDPSKLPQVIELNPPGVLQQREPIGQGEVRTGITEHDFHPAPGYQSEFMISGNNANQSVSRQHEVSREMQVLPPQQPVASCRVVPLPNAT